MIDNMNGAPKSVITGVPGWESTAEQYYLYDLASQVLNFGTIVEIGAEFGMSASLFCAATNLTHHIYSVDLFPGDLLDRHNANLAEAGFTGRTTLIIGDSKTVGKNWKNGAIDLLFIDGDHSYAGVKADIESWIKHVKIGGLAIFHDAAPVTNALPHILHYEVDRAINEWFASTQGWIEGQSIDSIRAFVRIG